MKIFFLIQFFLFCFIFSNAQTAFEKRYTVAVGCIQAPAMCKTPDGGFVIAGTTYNTKAPMIIKIDSLGNVLWKKRYYAGVALDGFNDIISTYDHNLVICGVTFNFDNGAAKILILKIDSAGNFMWSKYLGASTQQLWGVSIKETLDRNLVVYGNNAGAGGAMTFLASVNASGNLMWSHSYDNLNAAWVGEVIACKDKGFLYTQQIRDSLAESYVYVLKTDSLGNIRWGREIRTNFSGPNQDGGMAVRETSNHHYVIAGVSNDTSLILVKLDSAGNSVWTQKHEFGIPIRSISLDNTQADGLIISFDSFFHDGGFLVKTDNLGNVQWAKTYGAPDIGFGKVISLANGNGYVASGIEGANANHLIHFIKTDSSGRTGCEQNISFTSLAIPITLETMAAIYPGFPDSTITFQSVNIAVTVVTLCELGIHSSESEQNFDIFPNPSSGIFTISSSEIISSIEVFDLLGNVVLEKNVNEKDETIDLIAQPKGIYFVSVMDEKGNFAVKKIVMQ